MEELPDDDQGCEGAMDFMFFMVVAFAGLNLLFNLVKPSERCCCGGNGR
jgi:hypothetical protein